MVQLDHLLSLQKRHVFNCIQVWHKWLDDRIEPLRCSESQVNWELNLNTKVKSNEFDVTFFAQGISNHFCFCHYIQLSCWDHHEKQTLVLISNIWELLNYNAKCEGKMQEKIAKNQFADWQYCIHKAPILLC